MKRYLYILLALVVLIVIYNKLSNNVKKTTAQKETHSNTSALNELTNSPEIQRGEEQKKLFSDTPSGKSLSKIMELYSDLDAPDSENGKIAHAEIQKLYAGATLSYNPSTKSESDTVISFDSLFSSNTIYKDNGEANSSTCGDGQNQNNTSVFNYTTANITDAFKKTDKSAAASSSEAPGFRSRGRIAT